MPITTSYATMQAPIERIDVRSDAPGSTNRFNVRAVHPSIGSGLMSLGFEVNDGRRAHMTPETARALASRLVAFADQIEAGR